MQFLKFRTGIQLPKKYPQTLWIYTSTISCDPSCEIGKTIILEKKFPTYFIDTSTDRLSMQWNHPNLMTQIKWKYLQLHRLKAITKEFLFKFSDQFVITISRYLIN